MKKHRADNIGVFFALVRAGLWECSVAQGEGLMAQGESLTFSDSIEWGTVYRLAQEQSVVGLVAAGLEHVQNVKVPQEVALSFAGDVLQLEHRNRAMNTFVAELMLKLRAAGVNAVLVKGQGIAQCYERPLWRAAGDVDLLLEADRYEYAKSVVLPWADSVEQEYTSFKHIGMTMNGFVVELHGSLRTRLSRRVDSFIDSVQADALRNGRVRVWRNGDTDVMVPAPDENVIFLFTHILHHFFIEGVGLRQICDLCRLLWTYRDTLDRGLLKRRLRVMGLISEWRAFAAFAVDWLGMPVEAIPLYSSSRRRSRKGCRILTFVLECGNFGRNRKGGTSYSGSYVVRKAQSLWFKMRDFGRHWRLFPVDSLRFFWHFFWDGVGAATRGE